MKRQIETEPPFILDSLSNMILIAKVFHDKYPFFYSKNNTWWVWDKSFLKWKMTDEVDMLNLYQCLLLEPSCCFIPNNKSKIINSLKSIGRLEIPKEPPLNWIQFKEVVYDINKKEIVKDIRIEEYFFLNPIPWNLGNPLETPTFDKLFIEWTGKDYVQTLYEAIAYATYRSYPIHTILCLSGSGRNGKGQYAQIVERFLGIDNVCSTELDSIMNSQFASSKMYKKLACFMSETNYTTINKTTMLKKICGGDLISFEKKGKDAIDEYNYATIFLSTNALPPNEDNTDGWFSRWTIIEFPNQFGEKNIPIIDIIPLEEYNNLAAKIIRILPELLEEGKFTNQGTIEEQKERYLRISNPLIGFLEKNSIQDENMFLRYSELYNAYSKYLTKLKFRIPSKKEFSRILESMSIDTHFTSKIIDGEVVRAMWILGYNLKKDLGTY